MGGWNVEQVLGFHSQNINEVLEFLTPQLEISIIFFGKN